MNSQKQNRHSLMAKGIMVLLSLLVLVFIFTLAWFMDANAPATASGLSVSTSSNADFDMAIGFTTPLTGNSYLVSDFTNSNSTHIDFEKIKVTKDFTIGSGSGAVTLNRDIAENGEYNLLSDFKPIDLTGNGADKLYRPEMRSKNIAIDYTGSSVDRNITPNKQYISFDLYTRSSKSDFTIHLDKGSYVVGAAEVNNVDPPSSSATPSVADINPADLKGASAVRKSTYGDFSEDTVVGAVRVAFTQYSLPSTPTLSDVFSSQTANSLAANTSRLWVPRSDLYLQDAANGGTTGWSLYTSADQAWSSAAQFNVDADFGKALNRYDGTENARTVTCAQAAAEHWFYDVSKISQPNYYNRYTQVTSNVITSIEDAEDTIIINGISTVNDGTYYYGKCRVNLWIEGCDAEARKAINGGSFFFGFDLSAR